MVAADLDLSKLNQLHDWMREHGVIRAQVGNIQLQLGGPVPSKEAPPMTPEQVASLRRETKRRKYQIELGMVVNDQMLDRLP